MGKFGELPGVVMSNRSACGGRTLLAIIPFLKDAAFDQADIMVMSQALDDVCAALEVNEDMRARETIATRIIELARRGEHNPIKLRDRVLSEATGGRAV
jgi:hypothetical protein